MDRIEKNLRTSGRIVRDPVVMSYVNALACTLAPEYCDDMRVYVVQNAHFQASMRPNGAMEVWTGLLVRAQNEAQLGFVLAHEIAHFKRRHTLEQWHRVKTMSDGLVWLQIASAAAGHGYVGDIAQLLALTSLLAFNRDQEREADRLGLEMMARAGYDPRQAARIWEEFIEELEAGDEDRPPLFLSTHPSPPQRVQMISALAEEARSGSGPGVIERERFLGVMSRIRAPTLREEIRQRQFERTEVVLGRLLEAGVDRGEIEYYRGELCVARGEEGDEDRAIDHFESALGDSGAPAETHRELALLWRERQDRARALEHFESYLEVKPEASDRLMIEAYIAELR